MKDVPSLIVIFKLTLVTFTMSLISQYHPVLGFPAGMSVTSSLKHSRHFKVAQQFSNCLLLQPAPASAVGHGSDATRKLRGNLVLIPEVTSMSCLPMTHIMPQNALEGASTRHSGVWHSTKWPMITFEGWHNPHLASNHDGPATHQKSGHNSQFEKN